MDDSQCTSDRKESTALPVNESLPSQSPQYLPVCFLNSNQPKSAIALLFDPGSFASILTKQVVDDLGLEIQPSDQTISGVGSKDKPCLGKIETDIMIGNSTTWPKTTWYIVSTDMLGIPGIIGRNPLHCRLNEISYNLGNRTLFFRSRQGWARVPYISNPRTENWDSSVDKHFIYTITEPIPTAELVDKLRTELGPTIYLDKQNSDEAREICMLLLKHKQVFSSEDRPIGLVHGFEAEICTLPGRTAMVNQYRVPQKHEEPLTRNIEKLVSIGVLKMQNRQNIKLYIDDICIFSKTFDVFVKTVDEVFSLLTDHGFVVSPKKVFALQPEIRWLGRLISPIGSRANPENTQAILEITAPTSYKGLQRLLGMLQWIRQYAACRNKENVASKSFSQVIKPISALLKTNTPRGKFTWTRNASKALEEIKERLASPEFIYFPDWNHTFVLTTDASIDAIGYCLTKKIEGKSRITTALQNENVSVFTGPFSTANFISPVPVLLFVAITIPLPSLTRKRPKMTKSSVG
ncbi:unnamed protein product [Oikopleura dioica]|uniref:ribonuclease H n=2 Tax=Oikopleura dioica TaxID=34765 RepID=E4XXR9_OIKDI|nr:unnamed protein product [Oikopleura dioica]